MLFLRTLSSACSLCQISKRFVSFTPKSFFIALIAVSMASCSNNKTDKVSTGSLDTSPQIVKTANTPEEKNGEMSFTEADIEALKDKFEFDEKTGWYHHKHWGKKLLKRRTLTVDVNRTGYYLLHSNYFAPKKLNHTGIQVKLDGEENGAISEKVDFKSDNHRTISDSKGIFELNSYAKYTDNGIFEKIGKGGDASVNIRFITKRGYTEEELSKADQKAIQDCFRLSLILRQISK